MQEIIVKTFFAVKKQIDPLRHKYTFELFGYDFILDEDFNQWLIEVNTNPCLEESSQLLKVLLPRMIEDMLKLTVDQVFPKKAIKKAKKAFKQSPKKNLVMTPDRGQRQNEPLAVVSEEQPTEKRIHPVEGYPDNENMWAKLCNLDKSTNEPQQKFVNGRSCVQI